ncbi:AraC family ligand binding domain-containing protein [Thauera mechernichensis]|uniref:AraC family ligand binding domain-containing protein n=1 Tax=Thauera mechernichensis TaxID=82788 RepID=A0ABW3WDR4_9RHOO|nr:MULTISPECIES: AraC family transcriptional regulator [Thauera]ENO82494.1 AraC family transcriptional regulator [Thauera sp. 27]MDG3066937.1 AraC family transcriptional regulator [Thauera mechernichensis]
MQGVPEHFEHITDKAEFRRPPGRAGIELYRAHIVRHHFDAHTHEAYGFGVIEHGVERFRLAGSDHLAAPGSIVLMNPDALHTGRAETEQGWAYSMIYIDPDLLARASGDTQWWFSSAVVDDDPVRARRLTALLHALWREADPLAIDSLLLLLVRELQPHARSPAPARAEKAHCFNRVIDYMRAHLGERITLEALASVAGLSPFHFLRCFRDQHHVTPQQMLMALRLFEAKQGLAAGKAPAEVAADVGLADQAHLTRAFARRYGVTPARYQRQVRP